MEVTCPTTSPERKVLSVVPPSILGGRVTVTRSSYGAKVAAAGHSSKNTGVLHLTKISGVFEKSFNRYGVLVL